MKWHLALSASLLTVGVFAAGAASAADVGVSINVNTPGVYGRVVVGNAPPPLVYQQPVLIAQPVRSMPRQPIYLRVRPGEERNWSRYCNNYGACNQPVYFVKYDEAREIHRPPVRYDRHDKHHYDHGNGKGRGHDHH